MIITSMLDNDFYKYTMQQGALKLFPNAEVQYTFDCRDDSVVWTEGMVYSIGNEIENLNGLRITLREREFLTSIGYFSDSYIKWLSSYAYDTVRDNINIGLDNGKLSIDFSGTWLNTILYEVPILAIVNQVYNQENCKQYIIPLEKDKTVIEKVSILKEEGFPFADFGTRRRYSKSHQEAIICGLSNLPNFVGTSNMNLAHNYSLKPIGTMAHEWIMAGGGMDNVSLRKSQAHMLQKWCDVYRGDLGIALSDTYGTKSFLKDFDLYFAKLYDGVRHDSGDPLVWGEEMIEHFEKLGIDPATKTLVFSDGLKVGKSTTHIYNAFKDRIGVSMGIGTHLTNDFPGNKTHKALPIVIKMTKYNGNYVGKLSNNSDKGSFSDMWSRVHAERIFVGG